MTPPPPDEAAARDATLALIRSVTGAAPVARHAVLLGSGWGGLVDRLAVHARWSYAELPACPRPGVAGHAGQLLWGDCAGLPLWVLAGRQHAYESGEATGMRGALRTLADLGVTTLVQTNAAGSLRPAMRPGSVMALSDHLNLAQRSPLVGDPGGDRFVDLRDAYDPGLRAIVQQAAADLGLHWHEGVYAWMLGPQFETPAEIRMLQVLGADAVGMSTVPETILARQAGMKVLALSLITNLGCGLEPGESLSHAQTLAQARRHGDAAVDLLCRALARLASGKRDDCE